MKTGTFLLAFVLVTGGLAGALASTGASPASSSPLSSSSDVSPADEDPAALLESEDLETGRISYTASSPAWASLRLTLTPEMWDTSEWNGEQRNASFELDLAIEPGPDASPYIIMGVHARPGDPFPVLAPLALPGETPTVDGLEITVGCNAQCPEAPPASEIAFLLGDMQASSTLHMAIVDDPLPEDPTAALDVITGRDALDIEPDHTGTGGFAGTYTVQDGPDGTTVRGPYGMLDVTEPTLPADVGRTVELRGGVQLDVPGVGSVLAASVEDTGLKAWDWSAQLAEHRLHPVGAFASGPSGTLPAPLPEDPSAGFAPGMLLQVRTEPGQADLDLEERIVPEENGDRVRLVTWGWSTADLSELYGWPFQDIAAESSPVDLAPIDGSTPDPRICTGLAGPTACLGPDGFHPAS